MPDNQFFILFSNRTNIKLTFSKGVSILAYLLSLLIGTGIVSAPNLTNELCRLELYEYIWENINEILRIL